MNVVREAAGIPCLDGNQTPLNGAAADALDLKRCQKLGQNGDDIEAHGSVSQPVGVPVDPHLFGAQVDSIHMGIHKGNPVGPNDHPVLNTIGLEALDGSQLPAIAMAHTTPDEIDPIVRVVVERGQLSAVESDLGMKKLLGQLAAFHPIDQQRPVAPVAGEFQQGNLCPRRTRAGATHNPDRLGLGQALAIGIGIEGPDSKFTGISHRANHPAQGDKLGGGTGMKEPIDAIGWGGFGSRGGKAGEPPF